MTVSTTINRKEYTGDAVSTSFSFPYFVIAAADLKVYQNGTLKTITTHYTLSGSAPYTSGTNVQFVTAPAAADEIVIIRDPALTQSVDLVDNDPLPAASIETPLDRLTMIAQRLNEQIERSIRLSDTDVSGASVQLPAAEADKVLMWNSDASAIENGTVTSVGIAASDANVWTGQQTFALDVIISGAGKGVVFEGTTADAFETTLLAGEPTADRTITLPNATDTLVGKATTDILTNKTLTTPTITTGVLNGAVTGTSLASQAEMETATAADKLVTPSVVKNNPGVAKAWVIFNGTGTPAILASHNVTSITDNGVGDYTINFTTAFSSANYAVCGVASNGAQGVSVTIDEANVPTASACRIKTQSASSTADCTRVSVTFFGDQ